MDTDDKIWEVLSNFDWDRVLFVMTQLDWYWANESKPPSLRQLQNEARRLLKICVKESLQSNSYYLTASGGLEACCDVEDNTEVCLSLKFVVAESANF